MKTKISVSDALRMNGCEPGLARAIRLSERMGIPADSEVDFAVLLEAATNSGSTSLAEFMLQNKAGLLEYTDGALKCYLFNGTEYATLEETTAAVLAKQSESAARHKALTVCAVSEKIGEDVCWRAFDIDAEYAPDENPDLSFHVFDHTQGRYLVATTLEEARNLRQSLIASHVSAEAEGWFVQRQWVFAEDGVSTKNEPLKLADVGVLIADRNGAYL